jgi:hypothetical protein
MNMDFDNPRKNLISFDGEEIKRYMQYEMKVMERNKESFRYTFNALKKLGHVITIGTKPIDLNKGKWNEGKSYHWLAVDGNDIRLIIRRYGEHFTIYTAHIQKKEYKSSSWTETRMSGFTFYSDRNANTEKPEEDFYWMNHAFDLNNSLPQIIEMIRENQVHFVTNSAALKLPKWVETKLILDSETIYSIDRLIYACEELSNIHAQLFSETDMLEKIKSIEIGHIVDRKKVSKIVTEVKDNYYHAVGLEVEDEKGKKDFHDVYRLTRHYMEYIFSEIVEKPKP